MDLFGFIVTIIAVTASGALAPGPLFFGIIMHGSKEGARSGFSSAIGHMIVEFPLVLGLAFGLLAAANQPLIKAVIGLVGGVGLIGFGMMQIYATVKSRASSNENRTSRKLPTSSLILGVALTGLNPYFILWWLTIGSTLIIQALAFAAIFGVLLMYVAHVWMDYAFLTALAHFAKKGKNLVGSRYYKLVLVAFGAILVYYGASFIVDAVRSWL
jgi:threonine/homoserine/homoserine lactone efflux protein